MNVAKQLLLEHTCDTCKHMTNLSYWIGKLCRVSGDDDNFKKIPEIETCDYWTEKS